MALPPRRPNTFNVEPGTIKYSQPGDEGLTDYAFQRPVTPRGEVPQSLQGRSYLRPLLQATGDNGGPLSLADMEANSRAMDALDEHFMLRPSAKAAELMALEAETAKNEALTQDPMFFERGKMDLDFQRRLFEFNQQSKLAEDKAEAPYKSYDQFVDQDVEAQLAELRQRPSYLSAPPERRQAAEAALAEEARQKKAEIRRANVAGYPRDLGFDPNQR